MKPRALVFDIYGTIMEVGPPPPSAEEQWFSLWHSVVNKDPRMSRFDFAILCNRLVAQRHERSRGRGIAYPEILWPAVVAEALPEFRDTPVADIDRFATGFITLSRTVRLVPEAARFLKDLAAEKVPIGIASNAQKYTLQELQEHLLEHHLGMSIFDPDLCFWSFQHGFSKPDPHVFQILTSRFEQRGISAEEIVMVGDRLDNDIEPARRHGWQTWHYQTTPRSDWGALRDWLSLVKNRPGLKHRV